MRQNLPDTLVDASMRRLCGNESKEKNLLTDTTNAREEISKSLSDFSLLGDRRVTKAMQQKCLDIFSYWTEAHFP